MIDVRDHGAQGDGETDDTSAIESAMAAALGVQSLDGGDDHYITDRVQHRILIPAGRYRTTRPLVIRYMGITMMGESVATGGGLGSTIIPDHGGHAIVIDGSTYSRAGRLSLRGLTISRHGTEHEFSGSGVAVIGDQWLTGLELDGCYVTRCDAAVDFRGYGNLGFSRFSASRFSFSVNNYAIIGDTHLDGARVEGGQASQNRHGGFHIGWTNSRIWQVNLEGQPCPIVDRGTNSHQTELGLLRFEQNAGPGHLIDLAGMGATEVGLMYPGAGSGCLGSIRSLGHRIRSIELPITPVGCVDPEASGVLLSSAEVIHGWASREPTIGQPWASLSHPPTAWVNRRYDREEDFAVGRLLPANEVGTPDVPASREGTALLSGLTWKTGSRLLVQLAIRYNAPSDGRAVVSFDAARADGVSHGIGKSLALPHGAAPGDVITITVIIENDTDIDFDQALISVYPYGGPSKSGHGALVSPIVFHVLRVDDRVTLGSVLPLIEAAQ